MSISTRVQKNTEAPVDDSEMDVMTCLFYSESTEGNSQRAGQYGLAGGEREGHSGAESDRIRSKAKR